MVRLLLSTLIIVIVHGAINDICGQPPADCEARKCACNQNPDGTDYGCCGQCYEQADGSCDSFKIDEYDYTCGTILGLTCPTGYECTYTSACDPKAGGADCGGICNPTTTGSCPLNEPTPGDTCDFIGICEYGEESCCGETHPSLICECASDGTTQCYPSHFCQLPPCEQDYNGDFCGGIAAIPCGWTDYICVDNPDDNCDPALGGADCGGICRKFCGGIAGFPCPTDYECIDDPNDDCDPAKGGADCGGICNPIPDPNGDFCGGIAGFTCPTDYVCVDNPDDNCDPALGGADCGGICRAFCGGKAGFTCDVGYECIDDPTDDCDPNNGGADCGGSCEPTCTKICIGIYDPVCCAGVEYPSLCSAESDCLTADECDPGVCPPDDICQLPIDIGPCDAIVARYFYNSKTEACESFDYGGCQGNENNFELIEDCEKACHSSVFCTEEAIQCCDGSYVSRDPENNCEFALCPDCCGGFAGLTCDTGLECIDIDDDCDPENGGADCLGICTKPICELEAEPGLCKAYFPRYFYNSNTGQCEEFIYGGCGGNENNFELIEDCKKICDPEIFCTEDAKRCCDGSFVSRDPENNCEFKPCPSDCEFCGGIAGLTCPDGYECITDCGGPENVGADCGGECYLEIDLCSLPMEVGPCEAAMPRYYYNSQTEKCEEFMYGGCEGNENNFETMEKCQSSCDDIDICALAEDSGPCDAAFDRFFYNAETGECESFIWGGCEGNANNFEKQEDCENECAETGCVIPEDPFKYEEMEDIVCRFCFTKGNGRTCKEIPHDLAEIDFEATSSTEWWGNLGWIVNEIKNEPECFLEYCKGENSELRADCEVEDVRLKKITGQLKEDQCACNLIECVEATVQSNVGRLEVLIGIVLVLGTISWM